MMICHNWNFIQSINRYIKFSKLSSLALYERFNSRRENGGEFHPGAPRITEMCRLPSYSVIITRAYEPPYERASRIVRTRYFNENWPRPLIVDQVATKSLSAPRQVSRAGRRRNIATRLRAGLFSSCKIVKHRPAPRRRRNDEYERESASRGLRLSPDQRIQSSDARSRFYFRARGIPPEQLYIYIVSKMASLNFPLDDKNTLR